MMWCCIRPPDAHVLTVTLDVARPPDRSVIGCPGLGGRAEVELRPAIEPDGGASFVEPDAAPAGDGTGWPRGCIRPRGEFGEVTVVSGADQRLPARGVDVAAGQLGRAQRLGDQRGEQLADGREFPAGLV